MQSVVECIHCNVSSLWAIPRNLFAGPPQPEAATAAAAEAIINMQKSIPTTEPHYDAARGHCPTIIFNSLDIKSTPFLLLLMFLTAV